MARFPIIDSACPLRATSMPRAGLDHCGQCDRQVHSLDGMDNAQRADFMRSCQGKVCVAYTVQRRATQRNLVIGLGMAATLASSSAMAQGMLADEPAFPASSPVSASNEALAVDLNVVDFVVVGGVLNDGEVRWIDESEIEPATNQTLPDIAPLEWLPTKASP